jgi:hypothetical protein
MNDLIWYDITCHTDGCEWNNVTVRGQGPAESEFMCGPCGGMVDDWKISEDQTDGL